MLLLHEIIKIRMAKIIHQREKCIGCFYCVDISPNHWFIDETDGKSSLKNSVRKKQLYIAEIADFDLEESIQVADACPVNCIQIIKK